MMSRTVRVEDVFRALDGAPRHGADPTYDQARADVRAHLASLFTGVGVAVVTVPEPPNAHALAYQAGEWLVSRHDMLRRLVERCDCWEVESGPVMPDLEKLARGINAADRHGELWSNYEYASPPPTYSRYESDRAFDRAQEAWAKAGPKLKDAVALSFMPMSGGEKRMLRMLAMLAPSTRVRFNLSDSEGVDRGYRDDWLRLVSSP